MCKCTPSNRTPFCGKLGCEWPGELTAEQKRKYDLKWGRPRSFRCGYSDGRLPGLGELGVIRTNFVTGDTIPELFRPWLHQGPNPFLTKAE